MITPQTMTNNGVKKPDSRRLMLRNIPYAVRNQRDFDSHLPKTVYC